MNLRNGLSRPRHHLSIAPFATSTSVPTPALRVIVLLHLFHPEQWPEFRERLSTIRGGATQLLVAIPEGFEAEACIVDILAFDAKARIVRVANRGFDVGSHWQALDTIDLRTFDVAMLLQAKKSSHTRIGPIWRRNLVNALIGTPERWRDNLRAFASNPQVGMIGSAWHQSSFHPWTYPAMGEVLRALQMPTRFDEIKPIHEFVAGSMFMVRAPLLAEMHERTRGTIAFEPYELLGIARRSDESLAHAMERAFGLYVRWRGFEILWRP
jgi:lipopolysaccharide biosynthesis protein